MEEKRELNQEELEKVTGGFYGDGDHSPLDKRNRQFTCKCGFTTSIVSDYQTHMSQHPDHYNL